ncbi:MAG: hypothetical protein ACOYJB_01870 [Christensenellaceae bacterium]
MDKAKRFVKKVWVFCVAAALILVGALVLLSAMSATRENSFGKVAAVAYAADSAGSEAADTELPLPAEEKKAVPLPDYTIEWDGEISSEDSKQIGDMVLTLLIQMFDADFEDVYGWAYAEDYYYTEEAQRQWEIYLAPNDGVEEYQCRVDAESKTVVSINRTEYAMDMDVYIDEPENQMTFAAYKRYEQECLDKTLDLMDVCFGNMDQALSAYNEVMLYDYDMREDRGEEYTYYPVHIMVEMADGAKYEFYYSNAGGRLHSFQYQGPQITTEIWQ